MLQTSRQVVRPSWMGIAVVAALSVFFSYRTLVHTAPAGAFQDSKSAAIAKELTQALDAGKLDSIAAIDPAEPGTFVAALYIPGAQLLVVTAKYAPPALLEGKIKSKDYRDVYMDLQSASVAGTKIFVQDMLADGLIARPDGEMPGDVWEQGTKVVLFDRKKSDLNEQDYSKAFSDADARYAQMLSLLLAKARPGAGS